MARFPTYERRQGLAGGSTGSFADAGAFTAPSRALQGAGAAVADLGNDFSAIEAKVRETQDNTWFSKARAQTATDISAQEMDLQKQATDGAANFTPTVQGKFGEYRASKEAEAPSPRAKQMYSQWADTFGVDVTGRAAKFQAESELAKRTTDFSAAINAHAQAVYADPSQYDVVKKRMDDDFAGAKQWMTPEQEQVAKTSAEKTLQLARAKSLVEYAPDKFMQETGTGGAGGDVSKILRKAEGFRAKPYWDVDHWRVGYGSDTVTHADGRIESVHQGMTINRDDAERDLARRTKEEEQQIIGQVGPEAWGKMPPNAKAAILSVAYNYGSSPKSVLAAIKTGDVEQVAVTVEGLGSHNGGVNNKRRVTEAAIIRGGAIPQSPADVAGNPAYSSLSVDELGALQNRAEANNSANQTNLYNQLKGSMELGVKTGTIMSEDAILSSALRDDDKASLLTTFRGQNKDQMEINAALGGLANKTLSVDPYNDKARKALDGAYDAIVTKATPEQKGLAGEEIVRQSGVVPQTLLNELRRGLESTNPVDIAAAAQQASRISQINPAALSRREGGAQVQKAADDFGYYVNNLNLSPEQAAQKIADNNNPDKMRDRKALEPAAKEFRKQIETEDLGAVFDDSYLPFTEPAVGFNEGQRLGIQAEYQAIAEEKFYEANGDAELAKNRAREEMKRLYGVTDMTGKPTVMKHPPERYWPAIQGGSSFQYAKTQLYQDLYAIDPYVDTSKVQFVTTPETDAMIKRGEMPAYAVFYPDKNGVLQTIPGKLWRPNASTQVMMQMERQNAEQKQAESIARVSQDINRREAEMQADPMAARKAGLDAFIDGPRATPAVKFLQNKGK
ncbi:lysozyme [Candidatus Phyllobacterium onerii]|uniref:lysozyme n=1 Tax=Candidatus Phyllobacterium onerii TaxID=3020828 RepID=UPI00232EEF3A|nr:hypothetical protein [Phyllobacterium sp. IY22]